MICVLHAMRKPNRIPISLRNRGVLFLRHNNEVWSENCRCRHNSSKETWPLNAKYRMEYWQSKPTNECLKEKSWGRVHVQHKYSGLMSNSVAFVGAVVMTGANKKPEQNRKTAIIAHLNYKVKLWVMWRMRKGIEICQNIFFFWFALILVSATMPPKQMVSWEMLAKVHVNAWMQAMEIAV